ncbi:uncharacterized protein L201_000826 [Kwoniella dendrophila CBS 6074]|uniref:Asl1-like glycosyl hydrolase catalytic domain-containing protein n=1 Tax=Kwoniella dendrophila CBS 6074 TaxID=1295534 RepID=A0AAX4JLV2_9TREE
MYYNFISIWLLAITATNAVENQARATKPNGKAGIGFPVQEGSAAPVSQFFTPDSTVSWWFNWHKNWNQGVMQADNVTIDAEFIPMLWSTEFLDDKASFQEGFTTLLGYNEPDLPAHVGVSIDLEPAEASDKWKEQVVKIRERYPNVKVASPVMASNKTWILDFMNLICPEYSAIDSWGNCQYKPDYLLTHLYSTDVTYFKNTLSDMHRDLGLPMIISEFACYHFNTDPHPEIEQVSTYMENTMNWLDQQEWIIKYAWFGAMIDSANLHNVDETNRLLDDKGALTDLGKQYMNGGKKV